MTSSEQLFSERFDTSGPTTLVDWAYEELKAAIVDSRLKPGYMLREAAIAGMLGISKTPVREAFLRLKEDGLVELLPYRGVTITGYDIEDVREIFEIRAMLESECVRWAATANDREVIDQLVANVAETESALARGEVDEVIRLFEAFDGILFARMGNRRLCDLVENLQIHIERIGKLTTEIPGRLKESLDQHVKIVQAIAAGDPDAAQREMRAHITSVLVDGLAQLEQDLKIRAPGENRRAINPA